MSRMRVKQTYPKIAWQRIQFSQQSADGRRFGRERFYGGIEFFGSGNRAAMIRPQVQSVISRILRNQIQLLDAVRNKCFRFGNNVLLCSAAMRTAHARDDAEAAGVIAAFSDFQVSAMT